MYAWAVFVRRSPSGGPWSINVPGIGETEADHLGQVVSATQQLMGAALGGIDTNRQLAVWVSWDAVMEELNRQA